MLMTLCGTDLGGAKQQVCANLLGFRDLGLTKYQEPLTS